MAQFLILVAVALVAAALAWGVAVLLTGRDPGLEPAEPDGRSIGLPADRPLTEMDLGQVRFDLAARGYRMNQVDQALRRAGYDIGYKEELINVLEAEVNALREGRIDEAEALRMAREAAQRPRTRPVADDLGQPIELGVINGTEPDDSADGDLADSDLARPGDGGVAIEADRPVEDWVASGARASGAAGGQPAGVGPVVGPVVGSPLADSSDTEK
jgi:DivIVA domain-containing protein